MSRRFRYSAWPSSGRGSARPRNEPADARSRSIGLGRAGRLPARRRPGDARSATGVRAHACSAPGRVPCSSAAPAPARAVRREMAGKRRRRDRRGSAARDLEVPPVADGCGAERGGGRLEPPELLLEVQQFAWPLGALRCLRTAAPHRLVLELTRRSSTGAVGRTDAARTPPTRRDGADVTPRLSTLRDRDPRRAQGEDRGRATAGNAVGRRRSVSNVELLAEDDTELLVERELRRLTRSARWACRGGAAFRPVADRRGGLGGWPRQEGRVGQRSRGICSPGLPDLMPAREDRRGRSPPWSRCVDGP